MLRWVPGPSRTNERLYTRKMIAFAIESCTNWIVPTAELAQRVSWSLACVEALHAGASEWPEHHRACTAWRVVLGEVFGPSTTGSRRAARVELSRALGGLLVRAALADATERTVEEIVLTEAGPA